MDTDLERRAEKAPHFLCDCTAGSVTVQSPTKRRESPSGGGGEFTQPRNSLLVKSATLRGMRGMVSSVTPLTFSCDRDRNRQALKENGFSFVQGPQDMVAGLL